jgi:hypothetical protein
MTDEIATAWKRFAIGMTAFVAVAGLTARGVSILRRHR